MIVIAILVFAGVTGLLAQDAAMPLLLQGIVTDTDGTPIAGAVVEIWQTDVNGVYDHPGDSTPDELVDDFQYYGTATTDEDGSYAFLTIKPGQYEPRPVHIHFKVKIEDETILTSQFYFAEDGTRADPSILLEIEDLETEEMGLLRVAIGDIVLDLNGRTGNELTPTASQQEGPFYPVVEFAEYDNNLTDPQIDEDPEDV
ncbi:MAG: hypothetical protein AAGK74_19230, partial [Chloroflexota bacterium]